MSGLDGLEYTEHDALSLADLVRTKQVSASELLAEAISRAETQGERLNFIAQDMKDYGREKASGAIPDGPFAGVPFLVKDLNMHIPGHRSGQGSRLFDGFVPDVKSELVKRMEAAGVIIFGKTTTPEFGLTPTTESVVTGATRNPWNLAHSSGGSSGGASAAVAAGVIPMAHASDGGGSIRIPASACGLFGMKPSRGRIPLGPPRTEGWGGMSTNGVVSRSVRDSAAMMDATHGPEPGARYGAPSPDGTFLSQLDRDTKPLQIALMMSPFSGTPVDPEVAESVRAAARLCESLGHHVEEAVPHLTVEGVGEANYALISTALAADLDARAAAAGIEIGPDVLEPVTLGFYQTGRQMTGMQVAEANVTMQELSLQMAAFMQNYDVILSPVLAEPPAKLGVHDLGKTDLLAWGEAVLNYIPFPGTFNATGQPSMSVPLGMTKSGLPIGSMFTGRYGDEATLFALAGQLEKAQPWFSRLPEIAS
jgi:amidase/6-aminohexanoate-cyclic-dimer hydrolase